MRPQLLLLSNSRYRSTFSLKVEDVCSGIGAGKKTLQITVNRSEHKDPRMECNPLYFCYTSWLFCNPEPPLWPRQQYVAHLLPRRALWPQVQSVILPLYFSLLFGIRVGHESLLHLDLDLASSIRYTSVILFTAVWDPRGPRITLSS